jgi:hypothetical protein
VPNIRQRVQAGPLCPGRFVNASKIFVSLNSAEGRQATQTVDTHAQSQRSKSLIARRYQREVAKIKSAEEVLFLLLLSKKYIST